MNAKTGELFEASRTGYLIRINDDATGWAILKEGEVVVSGDVPQPTEEVQADVAERIEDPDLQEHAARAEMALAAARETLAAMVGDAR